MNASGMNAYGVVVLVALLSEFALGTIASLLNLHALAPSPPAALAGAVDAEAYRRSQAYTRARTRLGRVAATVQLAALLGFWFLGGFRALDAFVDSSGLGPVAGGVAYVIGLAFLGALLSLPFAVYGTFVVEERFGFNRTTPRLFVLDRLKGLLVGAVLGLPLLAAVVAFFDALGPGAWLWAWLVTAAYVLAAQILVPRFVMPLFNRFDPLPDGPLREALVRYARDVGFPLDEVYVMDGSKRSRKGNAFFTGFGRHKRIALFDTLVDRHSVGEMVAVTAHEVGHYQKGHILAGTALTIAHSGVLFLLLSLFLGEPALYEAFGVAAPSVGVGLVLFGLLYTPVDLVLSVALNAWSRRNEFAADRFAVETTRRPGDLADALKKLAADNLANLTPHPLHVWLYHSHPPVAARLTAIAAIAAVGARKG